MMTAELKREHINAAIQRYPINLDTAFISTVGELIKNNANLDAIIDDIAAYRRNDKVSKIYSKDFIAEQVSSWSQAVFITFTFEYEKSIEASNLLFHQFEQTLSKAIYKNAFRRNKKRCKFFAVSEGSFETVTRQHFHAIFELPPKDSFEVFSETIKILWKHGSVDLRIIDENKDAVITYLLKNRTKTSLNLLEHF
jgi:hypothetical protein